MYSGQIKVESGSRTKPYKTSDFFIEQSAPTIFQISALIKSLGLKALRKTS